MKGTQRKISSMNRKYKREREEDEEECMNDNRDEIHQVAFSSLRKKKENNELNTLICRQLHD